MSSLHKTADPGLAVDPPQGPDRRAARRPPDHRPPLKIYFKLSDIARLLEVEKHVLKYWEEAFDLFSPVKLGRRLNLYTGEDVERFREIRRLVHGERYTVEGAKMRLAEMGLTPLGRKEPTPKAEEGPRDGPEPVESAETADAGDSPARTAQRLRWSEGLSEILGESPAAFLPTASWLGPARPSAEADGLDPAGGAVGRAAAAIERLAAESGAASGPDEEAPRLRALLGEVRQDILSLKAFLTGPKGR